MSAVKELKFKKEVEKRLIDLDMNKTDLANRMGISLAYVYDILNGNRDGEERKKQMCEILGLEIPSEPSSA